MAPWDINAKRDGMPLYQFFGGKCRRAADVYVHDQGADRAMLAAHAESLIEQAFRHIRCQVGVPGRSTYGTGAPPKPGLDRLETLGAWWDPLASTAASYPASSNRFGPSREDVKLPHHVHERLPPTMAIQLAKHLEAYRLFFLEDVVAPEDNPYLRLIREQTSVPIAMGELYTNIAEFLSVI